MIQEIKYNIKRKIKERKTTIGQVCKRMRKDRGFINRITDEVKVSKIRMIAEAIGCTPSELLEGL